MAVNPSKEVADHETQREMSEYCDVLSSIVDEIERALEDD